MLLLLSETGGRLRGSRLWNVRCDCGTEVVVSAAKLHPENKTLSCGCTPGVVPPARREKSRTYQTRRRSRLIESGLCIECGAATNGGGPRCDRCRDENATSAQRVRRNKRAAGLCLHCSAPAETGVYCTKHYFARCASDATKRRADGPAIEAIFVAQGGRCAYTGVSLSPGENASLDHKTPKKRGGENTVANLQWVDLRVNVMKNDLTHEEFLAMVHAIARQHPDRGEPVQTPPPLYRWGRTLTRPTLKPIKEQGRTAQAPDGA